MRDQTPKIYLKAVAPVLPVRSLEESIGWYERELGFLPIFANGEPPVYAIVQRDEVSIHLQLQTEQFSAGSGNCYCEVNEVEGLHTEVQSRRTVQFVSKLALQEYGMKDFVIRDLDGNWIGFGAPAREQVE